MASIHRDPLIRFYHTAVNYPQSFPMLRNGHLFILENIF